MLLHFWMTRLKGNLLFHESRSAGGVPPSPLPVGPTDRNGKDLSGLLAGPYVHKAAVLGQFCHHAPMLARSAYSSGETTS